MRLAALALALPVLAAACGASQPEGRVGVTDGEPERRPIELELRTPGGVPVFVGDLRGKPLLLFVFATFDGVSQASLRPLARFVRHHPEVQVIGIAMQPEADALLDAWAHALAPPFTVTYDPRDRVSTGTSDLGTVDRVPTYVLIDPAGYEIDRHVGFASERKLERLLLEAGPRARPAPEAEPPPLLAE